MTRNLAARSQHGDPNPDKQEVDRKNPEVQGNTAVVEASATVTVPKRVRAIPLYSHELEEEASDYFVSCAFSQDSKVLFIQSGAPDYTMYVYDWSRSKILASLSLQIEATAITVPLDPSKQRICTSGADHLCFWNIGVGARELKALNPVKGLESALEGAAITDHKWLYDQERVVATSSTGKVIICNEMSVVQTFKNCHDGLPVNCVLAFDAGVTGAATVGDADDVSGFLTMGQGGLFCLFHYCAHGDNSYHKTPYTLSSRFRLESSMPGPPVDSSNFMDVMSLSLGPDIGDACLLFCSTPSGVITIDIGQLEAETDKDSFVVANSSNVVLADAPTMESMTTGEDNGVDGEVSMSGGSGVLEQPRKRIVKLQSTGGSVIPPPAQDEVETMPDFKSYRNFQYVSKRHAGRISGISAATRKCLVATCSDAASDSSVRIWNYKTRKLLLHQYFPGLQRPNSVSVHPSGNEVVVGFDDNVKIYHILASEMKQSHQINVKCMMHVYKKVRRGGRRGERARERDPGKFAALAPAHLGIHISR
jgi:WD40 repeat protein